MLAEAGLLLVPLAAGLLVLLTHLPLGEQVLKRGILFIDLAVAQLAALGALLAQQGWPEVPWAALAGGTLLVLADTLARVVIAPEQLPVGVITALLGVPTFLYLLYRSR